MVTIIRTPYEEGSQLYTRLALAGAGHKEQNFVGLGQALSTIGSGYSNGYI